MSSDSKLKAARLRYNAGEAELALTTAYIVPDGRYAFFANEGLLWLAKVEGGPAEYVESEGQAVIVASAVRRDIREAATIVYDRLCQMNGLQFVTDVILPLRNDIQFELRVR